VKDTLLADIYKILQKEKIALDANAIQNKLTALGKTKKSKEAINTSQIRDRIRSNPQTFIIHKDAQTNNTYELRPQTTNVWVLKTVEEEDRSSQTIDNYQDSLSEHYNYDSFVANFKQVAKNDLAILTDKDKILGFAKIGDIKSRKGTKIIRRCPYCPSTTIDKRKTKKPVYRCHEGHEFDEPIDEPKNATKYSAIFSSFMPIVDLNDDLNQLNSYYLKGYNQNMSMQLLSIDVLFQFKGVFDRLNLSSSLSDRLDPNEGYAEDEETQFKGSDLDEREQIIRAIKLRRGQQKFRKKLLERYNNTCVITGCKIIDILEAAHIKPYRGKKDNHPSNGLLLRADIHTLFDLNLLGIDPETLKLHFNARIANEYQNYHLANLKSLSGLADKNALKERWESFLGNSEKVDKN
jgi:hypothetical protein